MLIAKSHMSPAFKPDPDVLIAYGGRLSGHSPLHHFERYACSLVSILGWRRRIDRQQDCILKFALKTMEDITMMQVPGQYWIEAIPELQNQPDWLYSLPTQLTGFGKVLRKFWWALDCEGARSDRHNFSKTLIRVKGQEGLSEDAI
jgi:hypothetical protein